MPMTKPGKSRKKDQPDDGAEEAPPTDEQMQLRAERLQRELDEKNNTLEEYTGLLKQLQADFDNYRKHMEGEREKVFQFAKGDMIAELLPIIDSFENAAHHCEQKTETGEGVMGIYKQLGALLEKWGVQEIDTTCEFDPNFHEALMVEEGDEDNKIIEVFQKGYILGTKVIRTSKVKVSKSQEVKT